MAYRTHVVIDLDLDLDATPIAGCITTDHANRRPFQGWLELSSLIEERRAAGVVPCDPAAGALLSSRQSHFSQTAHAVPRRQASHPGGTVVRVCCDPQYRGTGWLSQRTHPMWMLLGPWTCAVQSSTPGSPALPATCELRHARQTPTSPTIRKRIIGASSGSTTVQVPAVGRSPEPSHGCDRLVTGRVPPVTGSGMRLEHRSDPLEDQCNP